MEQQFAAWMPYLKTPVPADLAEPSGVAAFELAQGLDEPVTLEVRQELGEGFRLSRRNGTLLVEGGRTGVLYGAYALMLAVHGRMPLPEGIQRPRYALRMLNCWDNATGEIERGYAGRSLFFEGNALCYDPQRLRMLGRMLAGCGINVLCVNNVNVHEPMQQLIEGWLPELARLAEIFRPFGVRLMVSVDFSRPMAHGVPTADPLDERVQRWWQERADAVYAAVPDLAGFLVKADSEHRPGPFTYGRTHSEGANMLARALRPHGGLVVWRCFVYNCGQDWRDTRTDRARAACDTYLPLDGSFDDNVILQVKYGPFDFQVREPVSPLLLRLEHTPMALELQLTQEYTGQQHDLFFMPPLWKDIFDDMGQDRIMAMAAVANLGRDANYTGHPFAAANLFAYGLTCWQPSVRPETLARLWARLTYGLSGPDEDRLTDLLLMSRDVYEKYTANLGLGWMVTPNQHYGPNPDGYEFQAWGTYHRADRNAVGVDRTPAGTGYTEQYPEPFRSLYASPDACPEKLLLFFHRLPYDYAMKDGRTLLQRLYDDHFEGLASVQGMAESLRGLPIPEPDRSEALRRMDEQLHNAREWCDILNTFFYRFTGIPDAQGRVIWP